VADRARFSITDAEALLELIYSTPTGLIVVVAGQAVNFWADRYINEDPRLRVLRPFTSRDLDLFGEIANAYRLASETHVPLEKPRRSAASPVLARVSIPTGHLIHAVEFLRFVRGVTNREITNNAIPFERGRAKFHVADPITMLKAKLQNVADLDQRGRSDERHVKILMLCVPLFLAKQLLSADETDTAARECLRNMQRIIALSGAPVARRVMKGKRFKWSKLLPIAGLERVKNARLTNFRDYQLKRWLARL
jgi:sulfur carrier protein ThiS